MKLKLMKTHRKHPPNNEKHKMLSIKANRFLHTAFFTLSMAPMFMMQAFAADKNKVTASDNMWTKATEIMQDVYTQVCLISTVAAVVTASVALLLMNFSKNGKTVDESRSWLKRIVISWVILNSLGFIIAYITPLLDGGKWNG